MKNDRPTPTDSAKLHSVPSDFWSVQLFNRPEALRRFSDDKDLLRRAVSVLLNSLEERVTSLESAVAERDIRTSAYFAHSLRSSFAFLSAHRHVELFARIEIACRNSQFDIADQLIRSARKSLPELLQVLDSI